MFKCWLKKFGTVWAWIILGCALFAEAAWIFTAISLLLWDTPLYAAPMFFGLLVPTLIGMACYIECNDARKQSIADDEYEREREERARAHDESMRQHAVDLAAIKAGTYVGG